MGITIAFEILALFAGSIFALLAFSFASRAISGGFIPALAVVAGILWVALFVNIDIIELEAFANSGSQLNSYEVTSRNGQDDVRTGYGEIQTEFVSSSSSMLLGDNINCATWHIKKSGTPDSNTLVRYGVWDNSATPQLKYTFGTLNVTNISTTVSPIKLCNVSTVYVIQNNDRIGVSWNDGNATNRITVDVDTTNPFDSTITYNTRFNGVSWIANTGTDMQGVLSLESDTDVITHTINFNDGATKIYMVAIGVMFMVLGAMQRLDKD